MMRSTKLLSTKLLSKRCFSVSEFGKEFLKTPVTTEFKIVNPKANGTWPMFRALDLDGKLINEKSLSITIDEKSSVDMYINMVRLQCLDDVFYNAQRQGRISFYMQNSGEEGLQVGSAAALSKDDVILAQYRETGVLLWRGFTLQQCADQCFSNEMDLGKGKQMPVHYGSKELNFHTISSPLTTQLPQAVGVAYAMKKVVKVGDNSVNFEKSDSISCVYFGEGAASEGDFHAAMNFASTLKVPMIFFCRNNGYAISTSFKEEGKINAEG